MSIFNLLHLEPMLHTLASVWTLAGELVTAGALLWCLNALARFIRLVYDAGRWTGVFWRQYFVPTVLFLADWISWAVAQVDWVEVRSVVKDCLVHIVVMTFVLGQYTRSAFKTAVTVAKVLGEYTRSAATVLTAVTVERVVPVATIAIVATVRTVRTVSFGVRTLVQRTYSWVERNWIDSPVQTVGFGERTYPILHKSRRSAL